MAEPAFDVDAAHRHFSKTCFNEAWNLIEKSDRTPADDEAMVRLNQASLWHWTQRSDCTDRHFAIGYWQASRIRALLRQGDEAMRYAKLSLAHSASLPPFYRASAHEALARAALVIGDASSAGAHATQARLLAEAIERPEERELVLADLAALSSA